MIEELEDSPELQALRAEVEKDDFPIVQFKRHRLRRLVAWLMFWRRAKFFAIKPKTVRKVDVKFFGRDGMR